MSPLGLIDGLRLDVDREDAINAWREAGLPEPTYAVENPVNGHAHLTWLFKIWVNLNNPVQKKFFEDIRYGFQNALKADRSFSGTEMTCSPWSDRYRPHVFSDAHYTLKELRRALPRFIFPVADGSSGFVKTTYLRNNGWIPEGQNCFIFWEAERYSKHLMRLGWFPDDAMRREVADFMRSIIPDAERLYPYSNQYTSDELSDSSHSVIRRRIRGVRGGARVVTPEIIRLEKTRQKRIERGSNRTRALYTATSNERRQRIQEWLPQGISISEMARRLQITRQEVYRLQKPLKPRVLKNPSFTSKSVMGCRLLQGYVETPELEKKIEEACSQETIVLNDAVLNLGIVFGSESTASYRWLENPKVCACGLTPDLAKKQQALFAVEAAHMSIQSIVKSMVTKTLVLHHESPELIPTKISTATPYRPKFADLELLGDDEDPFECKR